MRRMDDATFAGQVPDLYEQYLVPWLFDPYARDLAERVADLKEGTLLEIAAGTGAVTRILGQSLPNVRIIATDLNEAMVRVGASRVSLPNVTWQQADAQRLPFGNGSADAIVCQFGMMFAPDKVLAYREAMRVLSRGGRFLFSMWDRLSENPLSEVVTRAVQRLFPDNPPRFFERTPFGHFDADIIRRELETAGFHRIQIQHVEKVGTAPSAQRVALGLCHGTPLRGELEARGRGALAEATAAAEHELESRFGTGPLPNRMRALVITAVQD